MGNKLLTVIITSRNESTELIKTVDEIRRTVGDSVEIIVVDDASDDNFDYVAKLQGYNVSYLKNAERLGCAPSRDIAVNHCETPYFFIIDGHMRFYDSEWADSIVRAIKDDDRAIYCCKCVCIDHDTKEVMPCSLGNGAYLTFFHPECKNILHITWIKDDVIAQDEPYIDIPCVFGACYAGSKRYWMYIKGLEGLTFYSCDEQYLSLKVWMEGGRCRLITDVKIGHLFRANPPYEIKQTEYFYNKLIIIKSLFPEDLQKKMIRSIKAINYTEYVRASELLQQKEKETLELRSYYLNHLHCELKNFDGINDFYLNACEKEVALQQK